MLCLHFVILVYSVVHDIFTVCIHTLYYLQSAIILQLVIKMDSTQSSSNTNVSAKSIYEESTHSMVTFQTLFKTTHFSSFP